MSKQTFSMKVGDTKEVSVKGEKLTVTLSEVDEDNYAVKLKAGNQSHRMTMF